MYCLDINAIRIAWILNHCKINTIHYKNNTIRIVWILIHRRNITIHYKINDLRVAWILIHCRNNAIHCEINDIWHYLHCLDVNSLQKQRYSL